MTGITVTRVRRSATIDAVARQAPPIVVGLLALVAAAYWLDIAAVRWRDYQTAAFDLGFFDQLIWNTAHGRPFETTFLPYNFLGQHVEPVLLLFAAAYRLGAGPEVLLATQQLAATLAAIPLYAAGRTVGLRPWPAVAVTVAYLANPYLHRALHFDFHPEAMAALPAFAAAWLLARGHTRLGMAIALTPLLLKEDAAFVVLALAAWAWWRGHRRAATGLAAAAVAWALLAVFVVMPLARHGAPSDLVARYGWFLDASAPTILAAVVERAATAAAFIAISAATTITAPLAALWLAPGLLLALGSSHPEQATLDLHYAAGLVPVATLGTLVAATRLASRVDARTMLAMLLLPTLVGFMTLSPESPLEPPRRPDSDEHRAALAQAIALIPAEGTVSAQSGIVPRLSQRARIDEFPAGWQSADWVLIDAHGFLTDQTTAAGYATAAEAARQQLHTVFERGGVVVLRGGPR